MRAVSFLSTLLALSSFFPTSTAQQFAGDAIPNSLPDVPGSEITFFRIADPAGKSNNLTLTNYFSLSNGRRLGMAQVQRIVVIIHGLNRDPGTYMSNMLSALAQTNSDSNVNFDSVQIMAPYFPNGDDKNIGYPWMIGLKPGRGSTSNALVWSGSQWSAGANNQYPWNATTVSSYDVLDQLIQYFDDRSRYPNVKQIVIAGHSLGAQTVARYAQIGKRLVTASPVSYWIGNPNSWAWLSTARPFDTTTCPSYDNWREGFTNFTQYPMTYGVDLVARGRPAVLENYNVKSKIYARGTLDTGDDSTTCAPFTTGINRNERFFNFIKAFPPVCASPAGQCDIVDYVPVGHDGGAMMASAAGQARLFLDNFYGDGKRAFDFGYPRKQAGDDPYPNPAANSSAVTHDKIFAGGMIYQGCWTDNVRGFRTLPYQPYPDGQSNTIEKCTSACVAAGYVIAAAEFGIQCFCGAQLGPYASQTVDAGCDMECSGNSSEICGDGNRLSLYSASVPQQAALPGTPEVVGNYTSTYCYTEATSGRALSSKSYIDYNNMTLESCANFCNGFTAFGVEFGSECYCGSAFNPGTTVAPGTDCFMTCPGNALQYCGGPNRLTVYTLSSGPPISTINESLATSTSVASPTSSGSTIAGPSTLTSMGAAANPTGSVVCPANDGTLYTAISGRTFLIECDIDHAGGDMGWQSVSTFTACVEACSNTLGCVDVSLSGTACYLKNVLGTRQSIVGIWGARFVGMASSNSSMTTPLASISPLTSTVTTLSMTAVTTLASATLHSLTTPSKSSTGTPSTILKSTSIRLSGTAKTASVSPMKPTTLEFTTATASSTATNTTSTTSGMRSTSPLTSASIHSNKTYTTETQSAMSSTNCNITSGRTGRSMMATSALSNMTTSRFSGATTSISLAGTSCNTTTTRRTTDLKLSSTKRVTTSKTKKTPCSTQNRTMTPEHFSATNSSGVHYISTNSTSGLLTSHTTTTISTPCSSTSFSRSTITLKATSVSLNSSSARHFSSMTSRIPSSSSFAVTTTALLTSCKASQNVTLNGTSSKTKRTSTVTTSNGTRTSSRGTTVPTPSATRPNMSLETSSTPRCLTYTLSTVSDANASFTSRTTATGIASRTKIPKSRGHRKATSASSLLETPTTKAHLPQRYTVPESSPTIYGMSTTISDHSIVSDTSTTSSTGLQLSTSGRTTATATPSSVVNTTNLANWSTTSASTSSALRTTSAFAPRPYALDGPTTTATVSSQAVPTGSKTDSTVRLTTSRSSTNTTRSAATTTTLRPRLILPPSVSPVGCFADSGAQRVLPAASYSNSTNTPAQCASFCREKGLRFAGTQYGSECWCGNYLPGGNATTNGCSMPCTGDQTQRCGGGYRMNIYVDHTWEQSFFVREVYSSWTARGCYVDAVAKRTLPYGLTPLSGGSKNMTVANCLDTCAAMSMPFCGVEYFQECWGSRTAPNSSLALTGDPLTLGCDFPCRGNASEACGGANRLILYSSRNLTVDGSA